GDGDANSTAYVLQAKIAARANPAEITRTRAALLALQNPSGAFPFQKAAPDDNLLATVQAIPALNGVAFPTFHE
ncbi:MAG: cell wall anchor protein, partial [Thermomicrobiales bacterium]